MIKHGKEIENFEPATIRAHREACGFSQQDLADYLGVSSTTVWELEQGHRDPSVAVKPYKKKLQEFLARRPEALRYGRQLARTRQDEHLSRPQLAKKLGCSVAAIKWWEQGAVFPSAPYKEKMYQMGWTWAKDDYDLIYSTLWARQLEGEPLGFVTAKEVSDAGIKLTIGKNRHEEPVKEPQEETPPADKDLIWDDETLALFKSVLLARAMRMLAKNPDITVPKFVCKYVDFFADTLRGFWEKNYVNAKEVVEK